MTTSSTNITGFFISVRGSSLTNAWPIAGIDDRRIEQRGRRHPLAQFRGFHDCDSDDPAQNTRAGVHREMLDDRTERERREEGEAADDQDDADQEADEQRRRWSGTCRSTAATVFFCASEPAIAIAGMIIQKRPTSIASAPVML